MLIAMRLLRSRSRFLVVCFIALSSLFGQAQAGELYSEVFARGEQINTLKNEIVLSKMRLLSSDMPRAAQRLAENELNLAYYSLREAGRELSVLTQLKNISALVNEERRLHRAESLIASQKTAMRDLMKIHAEAIDKGLPKVQDPEVRKLLVRSRDVLQATASFVDGVPPLSAGS